MTTTPDEDGPQIHVTHPPDPSLLYLKSSSGTQMNTRDRFWKDRSIPTFLYLFVDALYFKVRGGIRYINKALLVVSGVRTDGYREILLARVVNAA